MIDKTINTAAGMFKPQKTYTPEEILAAGGATAFGNKSGKNMEDLITALKNAPAPEPFTNNEWKQSLEQLHEAKA